MTLYDNFFDRLEFGKDVASPVFPEDERFKTELVHAIDSLPERERILLGMIYEQKMNQYEIGEVLGVGESHISQLHSRAIAQLRSRMSDC